MSEDKNAITMLKHLPYPTYDEKVCSYNLSTLAGMGKGCAVPAEYTGWRKEVMSWHDNCYIHVGLNPAPALRISGPDATRFLSRICVNSFEKHPVGRLKHAIMVNERGNIMVHGVLVRVAEQEYLSYFHSPWVEYQAMLGGYDVQVEDITEKDIMIQLGGPRSLEIVEAAANESLHDVRFTWTKECEISGTPVRVLRVGMAGSLAYELHMAYEDCQRVYEAVMEAGAPYGITKLGMRAYQMTFTETGFPQGCLHFPYAWAEDEGFCEFLGCSPAEVEAFQTLKGSLEGIDARYRTPYECGWGGMVKFDHDFIGAEALKAQRDNGHKVVVTLEWDTEDVLDVHRSQFEEGEHYEPIDTPEEWPQYYGVEYHYADRVEDAEGSLLGVSSGRTYSYNYRKMLSLGFVNPGKAAIGDTLFVVWGDPGKRQKRIKATVARFPYLDSDRNEQVDVSIIPFGFKA